MLAALEAVSYAGSALPVCLLFPVVFEIHNDSTFIHNTQRMILETDSPPLASISLAYTVQLRYACLADFFSLSSVFLPFWLR